jgi:DNA-binding MarR family transcriptional regulator
MLELIPPHKGSSARPGAEHLAALVLDAIPLMMRELRQEVRRSRKGAITVPQLRILAQLACEPCNNKTLAENLGVSVAASSRMVDLLVKRGLVEREPGQKDKREIVLHLSPAGQKFFDETRAECRTRLARRFESFHGAKLQRGAAGLEALRAIFAEL